MTQDPREVTAAIGMRIAELRHERGLTQEQFSVALRASVQWVSQVEAGANLTVYSLVKLANALNVPLAELLVAPREPAARRRGRPKKSARDG